MRYHAPMMLFLSKRIAAVLLWRCIVLILCLTGNTAADVFVRDDIITTPSPDAFSVCYRHTCAEVVELKLEHDQWERIRVLFLSPPDSAEEERARIARAIGMMEIMTGGLANTANDKGGNLDGLFAGGNQLDCIDESTNSTTYLRMLATDGLLRRHSVQDRATRGFFLFGWPHTTAVIRDLGTQHDYAVDSWFYDNGIPPAILPLTIWRDGWEPEQGGY